jgi:hypothetical protein
VNSLIDQANERWDERNAAAIEDGDEELERMLPLIRLKVCSLLFYRTMFYINMPRSILQV